MKIDRRKLAVVLFTPEREASMTAGFRFNSKHSVQQVISVFLLLLCFFDLAIADVFFPGSCEGESERLLVGTQASTITEQGISSPSNLLPESQPAPAKSASGEEDCFCCCTHIVPIAFYKFPRPLFQTEPIASAPLSLPTAPYAEMFHPPRLA